MQIEKAKKYLFDLSMKKNVSFTKSVDFPKQILKIKNKEDNILILDRNYLNIYEFQKEENKLELKYKEKIKDNRLKIIEAIKFKEGEYNLIYKLKKKLIKETRNENSHEIINLIEKDINERIIVKSIKNNGIDLLIITDYKEKIEILKSNDFTEYFKLDISSYNDYLIINFDLFSNFLFVLYLDDKRLKINKYDLKKEENTIKKKNDIKFQDFTLFLNYNYNLPRIFKVVKDIVFFNIDSEVYFYDFIEEKTDILYERSNNNLINVFEYQKNFVFLYERKASILNNENMTNYVNSKLDSIIGKMDYEFSQFIHLISVGEKIFFLSLQNLFLLDKNDIKIVLEFKNTISKAYSLI